MALDLEKLSSSLFEAVKREPFFVLSWDPSDPDSTTMVDFKLTFSIMGPLGYKLKLNLNKDNYVHIMRLVQMILADSRVPLIGFNFKYFFSLNRKFFTAPPVLQNVYDICWYESYSGSTVERESESEVIKFFKLLLKNKNVFSIYNKIFKPLITKVLPDIESLHFINDDTGKIVYSNYVVEGQENGRLSCNCSKKNCFNPHSLGEDKKNLRLSSQYLNYILQFDYKNMEVAVLAKMSGDTRLNELVDNFQDSVYSNIFEDITGLQNFSDSKTLGKKIFLPLIYGQTHMGLARSLDISADQAIIYFERARAIYSKAFSFVEKHQQQAASDAYVTDIFGRKRFFVSGESYKARNFVIQSPSALICIEALVKLHTECKDLYKVAFHVHDGYFLALNSEKLQDAFFTAKQILESKTNYMPELQLKVSAKVGRTFDKMVLLKKKEKAI